MNRKMKDSGVEWIGEIPEGWAVAPIKSAVRWKSKKGRGQATVLSLYRDYGVIPKDSRDDNHNVTSLDTDSYKYVDVGDLVINKMKAWQGSMAISKYEGIVSPAYHVCRLVNPDVYAPYFNYLIRNVSYLPEYTRLSTGMRVGQWDLAYDDFVRIPFLIPSLNEQQRIADYLDTQTAAIDASIAKTQESIEEYKKLKQAVITQAVTKGIRPGRAMKDSGVEWWPYISEDCEITRIGRVCTIILGKMLTPQSRAERDTIEPYFCAANVHFGRVDDVEGLKRMWFSPREKDDYLVIDGDMLVVEGGAGAGGAAIVKRLSTPAYIQNSIMIVRGGTLCDNRYVCYALESLVKRGYIDIACNKATIPHFTKEKLSATCIPYRSKEEQQEIAAYLDEKCAAIDTLIEKKQQIITELEAYKKSLIYEYVTGKKEVPMAT